MVKILEIQIWQQGDAEKLKNLGLSTCREICFYFPEVENSPHATSDPHYLIHRIQFSQSQTNIKKLEVNLDRMNRANCSGVKVCAGEG